jgi:hypothetical protein
LHGASEGSAKARLTEKTGHVLVRTRAHPGRAESPVIFSRGSWLCQEV